MPDDDALASLLRRAPALQRSAFLLTGDWGKAEDLVQDALVATWRKLPTLRHPEAAEAYMRTCMARAAARSWSAWARERVGPVPEVSARDAVVRAEDRHDLLHALRRLNPRQRSVVVLRFFEELSEAETAAVLGWPIGTVKSTTARALTTLSRSLSREESPAEADPQTRQA